MLAAFGLDVAVPPALEWEPRFRLTTPEPSMLARVDAVVCFPYTSLSDILRRVYSQNYLDHWGVS